MSIDSAALRAAIKARLDAITGLRAFTYPPGSASPPMAMVGYPMVEFDSTKGRGVDRAVIPVAVLVGAADERSANDALDAYLAGAGAASVKAALDGNLGGAAQSARVMRVESQRVPLAGIEYLGAVFELEVYD